MVKKEEYKDEKKLEIGGVKKEDKKLLELIKSDEKKEEKLI